MLVEGSILELKGVGEKTAKLLNKLGIYTIRDVAEYFPRSYDVFSLPVSIDSLREGQTAAIECLVGNKPQLIKASRFVIVSLLAKDPSGTIRLVWYNTPYISKQLSPGTRYIFRGRVTRRNKELIIAQPVIYSREAYIRRLSELQPVYPLTKGVTCNLISKLVREALPLFAAENDYIKASECSKLGLMKRYDALQTIHFPPSREACINAHRRLVFDEFVSFMVHVRIMKENRNIEPNGYVINDFTDCDSLISSLPYKLTGAQLRVFDEIKNDLSGPGLMSRMIQGDVGSGKTIVAMLAVLACVRAGYQACIMAPTEVLARQHYEAFSKQLASYGISTGLLVGGMTSSARRKMQEDIKNGEVDVVVGTHALIQDKVEYKRLALAVIDEQHRFGVAQREAVRNKGNNPHILAMSATPIPRSLAIILYGDLDLSIIDEMPKGRLPIKNCVVGTAYRPTAYNFIKKEAEAGHQAYIICPMIEESDDSELESVLEYTDNLKAVYEGTGINVDYLHGKMKPADKNAVMERFKNGEIQVLVSTTVIEVGVNVPNATVMMVENAERFGLAQLHQLRGRVGRGDSQSYCIFIKGIDSADTEERLNTLVKYNDGMKVAEEDLRLRGPGDFFGTRQSGEPVFKVADIYGDADVLKMAKDYVNNMSEKEIQCFSHTLTDNWII